MEGPPRSRTRAVAGPLIGEAPAGTGGARRRPLGVRAGAGAALVTIALALASLAAQREDDDGAWQLWGAGPVAVLAVLLLCVPGARRARLVRLGLLAFAAFAAWNAASLLWAEAPGDAWAGTNRVLIYGAVLLLVVRVPWSPRAAAWLLGATAAGACALGVGLLVHTAAAADLRGLFVEGRLAQPTGYANASAALWALALWPALHLAVAPRQPAVVRAVWLAAATVLLSLAVLTQSRGVVAGLAAGTLTYLAVTRLRWRALGALAIVAGVVAAGWTALGAPAAAGSDAALRDALADARAAVALGAAASAALGLLAVVLGRRVSVPAPRAGLRRMTRIALPLATLVVVLAVVGSPVDWAQDRWRDFRSDDYAEVERHPRLSGSLASSRYDFYRVALLEFRRRPLTGLGSENFAAAYLLERRTREAPRHPHSLAFRTAAQLGLPGVVTLVAALGFLVAAAIRRRTAQAGAVAAALAATATWLGQGLADRLWEVAGLGVLAFAMLGLAARVGSADPYSAPAGPRRPLMAVLAATIAALAVLSLVLAGVARLLTDRDGAARTGADLPRLAWAARVDPLSADPPLVRAIVARRAGRPDVALRALREAGRREPGLWLVPFELGLLHAAQGRRGLAVAQLDRAFALNPAQPVIQTARRQVVTGRRVDPDAVEDLLSPVARPAETRVLEDVRPSSYRLPAYNAGSRDR